MAKKGGIQKYNAVIAAIRKQTGVTQKQAQQTYRTAKVRLGHAPAIKDVKSAAVREGAKRAGAQLKARQAEKEKRIERIVREVREQRKAPKKLEVSKPVVKLTPPPKRRAGADRGGGGGAGGGGAGPGPGRRGREEAEFGEYPDYEDLYQAYDWEEEESP